MLEIAHLQVLAVLVPSSLYLFLPSAFCVTCKSIIRSTHSLSTRPQHVFALSEHPFLSFILFFLLPGLIVIGACVPNLNLERGVRHHFHNAKSVPDQTSMSDIHFNPQGQPKQCCCENMRFPHLSSVCDAHRQCSAHGLLISRDTYTCVKGFLIYRRCHVSWWIHQNTSVSDGPECNCH